jgi:hypothetical protein
MCGRQKSSVGTATGYGLEDRGLTPDRGKTYSLLHTVQTDSRSTQPPIKSVADSLSRLVERRGYEADQSSGEVEIGGAIPPLPHVSSWHRALIMKHREDFTFYLHMGMQFYLLLR